MTTNPTTPKRWRPKFSLRTLVILVTLVCCYAACWGPTKTRGGRDVEKHTYAYAWTRLPRRPVGRRDQEPVLPFIVRSTELGIFTKQRERREYYFWFFGYVVKLPYERETLVFQFPCTTQYDSSTVSSTITFASLIVRTARIQSTLYSPGL